MAKRIDETNLGYLISKIKAAFWPKTDVVSISIDSTPTANSTNLVTSGGVKNYVDNSVPSVPVTDVTVGGTSVVSGGVAVVPAIPTVPTISTNIASDATSDTKTTSPKAVKTFVEGKGYGTYSKPSGGIPATDIASGVIPTVPTALSSFTDDLGSSPTHTHSQYLTSHQDISGKADKVIYVDASTPPSTMDANKVYQYGTLSGNTTFPAFTAIASGDTEVKIWCWTFTTPSTAPTITWPAGITAWNGGSAPTINASKSYEVSVMDGLACIIES